MNSVITIGRQYGSDGRAIGEKLAKDYNIPFYDKDILARASKESGICEDLFKDNDEKKSFVLQIKKEDGQLYSRIILPEASEISEEDAKNYND